MSVWAVIMWLRISVKTVEGEGRKGPSKGRLQGLWRNQLQNPLTDVSFREEMRSFHDLMRQKPSSLFIFLDGAQSHATENTIHHISGFNI
jgi:hypothetical protein